MNPAPIPFSLRPHIANMNIAYSIINKDTKRRNTGYTLCLHKLVHDSDTLHWTWVLSIHLSHEIFSLTRIQRQVNHGPLGFVTPVGMTTNLDKSEKIWSTKIARVAQPCCNVCTIQLVLHKTIMSIPLKLENIQAIVSWVCILEFFQ